MDGRRELSRLSERAEVLRSALGALIAAARNSEPPLTEDEISAAVADLQRALPVLAGGSHD